MLEHSLAPSSGAAGYEIANSLRFEADDTASLNRTFSAGDTKKWTWAGWIKRTEEIYGDRIFACAPGSADSHIKFLNGQLNFQYYNGSTTVVDLRTTALLRDPAAWYHIVVIYDSAQATNTNRVKIYVNGVQLTDFSTATYPSQNLDTNLNSANAHYLSRAGQGDTSHMCGYMAEVYFVDGQALGPENFGETGDYGEWKPIEYTGTYGTNGFYLQLDAKYGMAVDMVANYDGTKVGSTAIVYDSSFGDNVVENTKGNNTGRIDLPSSLSNSTIAGLTQFSVSGWVMKDSAQVDHDKVFLGTPHSDGNHRGWICNMHHNGTQLGFAATIYKNGTTTVYCDSFSGAALNYNQWYHYCMVFDAGNLYLYIDNSLVSSAYNASAGNINTSTSQIGAFFSYLRLGTYENWGGRAAQFRLYDKALTSADRTALYNKADEPTDNLLAHYPLNSTVEGVKDYSGNGNTWATTNLETSDFMLDSPTNNFCTLNAIDGAGSGTLSEGNLKFPSTDYAVRRGTFQIPKTGKWYWEWVAIGGTYGSYGAITSNVTDSAGNNIYGTGQGDDTSMFSSQYYDNYTDTAPVTSHGSYTSGDICQVAFDADIGTAYYYKNGTLTHTDTTLPTNVDLFPLAFNTCCSFSTGVWNFGQDSSFAGNKTAQGNTDGNGYGDFYYAPPTGYLALCTANLPDPTVIPSEHFNTVLYTGDGTSSHAITGIGFQPDWVWLKERSVVRYHQLYDVVRGTTKDLATNSTDVEATISGVTSFDSDGFTVGSHVGGNENGQTFVAWNWKANGAGVSNTDGTITSTVSANTSAGFSIVNFVGTGSNGTVGHGLTQTPELIINKPRDRADNWNVYCEYNGTADPETDYLILNSTSAPLDNNTIWNDTAPTSSVFNVGTNGGVNASGENFINYCFHSVDGFSKVGSYTGNGATTDGDQPFVYTGFRPAFILIKRATGGTEHWYMVDRERNTYNAVDNNLKPNSSTAEETGFKLVDFTSNGFKIRTTDTTMNYSGSEFIYLAFAENPFKHTNAR